MNSSFDTIVVGAGLAGACAAFYRSQTGSTLLLDAGFASRASGAAAGLVNPVMGRRARKVWKADEALDALTHTLAQADASHLFVEKGVLRPAASAAQAADFKRAALPGEARWLPRIAAVERYPDVRSPHGALMVERGGSVAVQEMVGALIDAAVRQSGLEVETAVVNGFGADRGVAWASSEDGRRWKARRVILAPGAGYLRFPDLARLALHRVKGQVLEAARPNGLPELPCISGLGYIAPAGDRYVLGSSYEHQFSDLEPNPAETRVILEKTARMVPRLAESTVLDVRVGVRVTVPGTRRPMVGPLPGRPTIWVFTGLGSKGILMAPLISRRLHRWMDEGEPVWEACAVRRA